MPNLNYLQEHLGPIVGNLIDLGGSLLRWRKIWTWDIDINGTGQISTSPASGNDITNKTYVDAQFSLANATVEEVDGSPSYTSITTLRFDQGDGFVITNPSAGVARIDLTASGGTGTIEDIDSVPQYTSNTILQFDQADGFVITQPIAGTSRIDLAAIPDAAIAALAATKLTGQVAVANGGTGASTLTDTGVLLGNGTGAIQAVAAMAKGGLVVGQTTADPVALAVGANRTILEADSSTASGLAWTARALGAKSVQVFVTAGAATWTKPTGIRRVIVEVVGGGGGGGGKTAVANNNGGGGGGGGYAIKLLDVSAIATSTLAIGAGGTQGASGDNSGGTGGTTSWTDGTNTITCIGGTGGGGVPTNPNVSAAGGTASGGDVNLIGQQGGAGSTGHSFGPSCGGNAGGGMGQGAPDTNFGGGAANGKDYGGGGGGAASDAASAGAGGTGGQGIIIVWEME